MNYRDLLSCFPPEVPKHEREKIIRDVLVKCATPNELQNARILREKLKILCPGTKVSIQSLLRAVALVGWVLNEEHDSDASPP